MGVIGMGRIIHCTFCGSSGDESFYRLYQGSWCCNSCLQRQLNEKRWAEQEAREASSASSGGGSSTPGTTLFVLLWLIDIVVGIFGFDGTYGFYILLAVAFGGFILAKINLKLANIALIGVLISSFFL